MYFDGSQGSLPIENIVILCLCQDQCQLIGGEPIVNVELFTIRNSNAVIEVAETHGKWEFICKQKKRRPVANCVTINVDEE